MEGKEYQFEGVVEGSITQQASGNEGFGYDPVFIPNGYDSTFAEMALSEKNKISHRARAVSLLVDFLKAM
jgi:XTP/dITP diphosphohydrolase